MKIVNPQKIKEHIDTSNFMGKAYQYAKINNCPIAYAVMVCGNRYPELSDKIRAGEPQYEPPQECYETRKYEPPDQNHYLRDKQESMSKNKTLMNLVDKALKLHDDFYPNPIPTDEVDSLGDEIDSLAIEYGYRPEGWKCGFNEKTIIKEWEKQPDASKEYWFTYIKSLIKLKDDVDDQILSVREEICVAYDYPVPDNPKYISWQDYNSEYNQRIIKSLGLKCLPLTEEEVLQKHKLEQNKYIEETKSKDDSTVYTEAFQESKTFDQEGILRKNQIRKIIKLSDFLLNYCDKTTSIRSKVNRIHENVTKGKLPFFPKPINNPQGTQPKVYIIDELKYIWPETRIVMSTLPPLK